MTNSTPQSNDLIKKFGKSTRDGFGLGLLELMKQNPKVVALSADLSESTRVNLIAKTFPNRFIQLGVAEQNLAGVAAGLALSGLTPFITSYAVFNPGNNWGVIRSSICYSNLPVRILGGHAGLATGADGATHQALEDLALMRVLPNMTVLAPANSQEAYELTLQTTQINGPVYIRTNKIDASFLQPSDQVPINLGRARQIKNGSDLIILAHGAMVERAQQASEELVKLNIKASLFSFHTLKPIDTNFLNDIVAQNQPIVTIEDHQRNGGLGTLIAEYLSDHSYSVPLLRLGVNDKFGQSGSAEELYDLHSLSSSKIKLQILNFLNKFS